MDLALELPLNQVSFGNVSICLLKTIFERERAGDHSINWFLFPIGNIDLSGQTPNPEFNKWLETKIQSSLEHYKRSIPVFKLWHLNGSLTGYGKKQTLLTFYELDSPTVCEANTALNSNTVFSSRYACEAFKQVGVDTKYLPLAFDSFNFSEKNKKYFNDQRIVFTLCGKLEKRKHHGKIIQAWIKKFGNNPKYALQCAVVNPFLNDQQNQQLIGQIVGNNKPFNVTFYPKMQENMVYNDFLNSGDIVIGMSSGEGWGLPEFQSVAIGKHAVLLKAHAYPDWATDDMVTWVKPSGKEPIYDNIFFHKGGLFKQGNGFTWNDDDFILGCEQAISRVEKNRKNEAGLQLQTTFSKEKFLDNVIMLTKEAQ